jgi:hypothetical protein
MLSLSGSSTIFIAKAKVRCRKRAASEKGNNIEGGHVTNAETLL